MNEKYSVLLTAKGEGVEYRDSVDVYRFNVDLRSGTWIVQLPPTRGDRFTPHQLSSDERACILPRIAKYLSRIWWLGFFPRSYTVAFEDENRDLHGSLPAK